MWLKWLVQNLHYQQHSKMFNCFMSYTQQIPLILTRFPCDRFLGTCAQQVGCIALVLNSEAPRMYLSVQRNSVLWTANVVQVQKGKE